MDAQQKNIRALEERLDNEVIDTVDEELEMEIDDDRLSNVQHEPIVLPEREHKPGYTRHPVPKGLYVPNVY